MFSLFPFPLTHNSHSHRIFIQFFISYFQFTPCPNPHSIQFDSVQNEVWPIASTYYMKSHRNLFKRRKKKNQKMCIILLIIIGVFKFTLITLSIHFNGFDGWPPLVNYSRCIGCFSKFLRISFWNEWNPIIFLSYIKMPTDVTHSLN